MLRAFISVSDKSGVVEFAQRLVAKGFEIVSTGGTAKLIGEHNIPVVPVSEVTDFPEILDGRVKSLHPKVFGGVLARGAHDSDILNEHHISPFSVVAVNLYPFADTVSDPNCTIEQAVENIDVGGPALLRAAAKNFEHVWVVSDPKDYTQIINGLEQNDSQWNTRKTLAQKAFAHTAHYDQMIAEYFLKSQSNDKPLLHDFSVNHQLRYGENPHQRAFVYRDKRFDSTGVVDASLLQGRALSFNNLIDADTAYRAVCGFQKTACVIVKHATPCGAAIANDLLTAYQNAYATDGESAFGGIIAFNRRVDEETVSTILDQQFVEVLIAPEFSEGALALCEGKPNLRVLQSPTTQPRLPKWDYRIISGGCLVQQADEPCFPENFEIATKRAPADHEWDDLKMAWQLAGYLKSNAICFVKDQQTLGIGAGQTSRIFALEAAKARAQKAGLVLDNAIMASDGFFPFPDSIEAAYHLGVRAIIQPGGSIRDSEVIAAANERDIAMVFTRQRHFRH